MAHEKSDPKVGLIAKVAIIGIVFVSATRWALGSYFSYMNDREHFTKYSAQKPEDLNKLREDEAKRLSSGPMPIASSMRLLAADKRQVPGLEPKAADPMREKDTMAGWMQMPRPMPEAPAEDAAAPAPMPSSSAATGDAAAPAPSTSASAAAPAPSASAPAPKPSVSAPHGGH